jgi:hypothetical protein
LEHPPADEPASVALYIREYACFKSSTLIDVVDVPPEPPSLRIWNFLPTSPSVVLITI